MKKEQVTGTEIVQIMPAPPGLSAVYFNEGDIDVIPILCLALCEEDGQRNCRWIIPMTYEWDKGVDSDAIHGTGASLLGYHYAATNNPDLDVFREMAKRQVAEKQKKIADNNKVQDSSAAR